MHILIMSDSECLGEFCSTYLASEGHTIYLTTTKDYQDLLASRFHNLDAVFINVNPMDANHIPMIYWQVHGYNPNTQIVLLTINMPSKVVDELVMEGCKKLIVPFLDGSYLLDVLEEKLSHNEVKQYGDAVPA